MSKVYCAECDTFFHVNGDQEAISEESCVYQECPMGFYNLPEDDAKPLSFEATEVRIYEPDFFEYEEEDNE